MAKQQPKKSGDKVVAAPTTHIYVLLDRSGSMSSIRSDVIGGLNSFLADQKADGSDARVTFVQFDGQDPGETIFEALRIDKVPELTDASFVPRGSTPLLDATGLLVGRANERVAVRVAGNKAAEEILFVTITDGHENASSEFTRDDIRKLVAAQEAKGWTFVFLSAALDVYGEAGGIGYDSRGTQTWTADAQGTDAVFRSLSESALSRRGKTRRGELFEKPDFFEGSKPAEEDRKRRGDS